MTSASDTLWLDEWLERTRRGLSKRLTFPWEPLPYRFRFLSLVARAAEARSAVTRRTLAVDKLERRSSASASS